MAYDNCGSRAPGNSGNNTLEGGGGNDELSGGGGEDTAAFSGPAADYEIVYNPESVTVRDTQSDRDGADRLQGIELLRFSDSEVRLRPQGGAGP